MLNISEIKAQKNVRSECALIDTFLPFIDHIAPICSILDIPLVTRCPISVLKFQRYYPGLRCQIKDWDIKYLLNNYKTIFYGFKPEPSFYSLIEEEKKKSNDLFWHNKIKFIYHLHGCSDKGYHCNWLSPTDHMLQVDDFLIYGQRMKDLFIDTNLLSKLKSHTLTGNYRKVYYEKHKSFFDQITQDEIFSQFERKQKTYLYAPSWVDPENSCSFFKAHKDLFDNLPGNINLLVKLHPHLDLKLSHYDPGDLLKVITKYNKRKNIVFSSQMPLVYPILNSVDGYIGDFSSVGYDALNFNIPLYFIKHNERESHDKGSKLHKCGKIIHLNELKNFFKLVEKNDKSDSKSYSFIRKNMANYAFGEDKSYLETSTILRNLLV